MRNNPEQILKRYEKANAQALLFRQLYEDAYNLVTPDREMFSQKSPGQDKAIGVYDSAGMRAGDGFVSRFISTVCPAYQRWAELKAGPMLDEDMADALNEALELINKQLFSTLHASNFNTSVGEFAYDVGVGTGVMLVLEHDDLAVPFRFLTVSPAQIAIEDNAFGEVCAIFRKFDIKNRHVKEYYPDGNFEGLNLEAEPDKELCIVECTYHDPEKNVWYYDAVVESRKHKLAERKYSENPWIVLRWSKLPNEPFGRGPFVKALPDLKTMNKIREMSLRGLQLATVGVFTGIHSDIINAENVVFEPGAIIPVERNGGPNGPTIASLPVGGNPQYQALETERLEMGIRELLMDNRLPPEAGSVRSATEIVERVKQLQMDVGAAYGRIMNEFVIKLLKRIIGIMERKGLIKLPEGMQLDNLFLKVELQSPLARVQKMDDLQVVVNSLQLGLSVDPQMTVVPLIYDMEKVQRFIAEQGGVPASLIRSNDEVEEVKQQTTQAAMMAQAVQGAQ